MKKSYTASRRVRRAALAVAVGGSLALGAAGLAYADDPSTPPSAPAGTPPVAARPEHKPQLDGTVKQIATGKILIVDRDGFTRQINIAAAPAGVRVGTRIHAEGTVDPDGVSLDATSVVVAPQPGPGGPGKRGPAGPDGRRLPRPPAPGGHGAPPSAPAPRPSGS